MKSLLFLLFIVPVYVCSQEPVTWNYTAKKLATDIYEIKLTAQMQPGWHIYSQSTPTGGPTPTEVIFKKNPLIQLEGNVKEIGRLEQIFEKEFGVNVKQYSNTISFIQVIRKKAIAKTKLTGTIEFMTCNEEMCLPAEKIQFNIDLL